MYDEFIQDLRLGLDKSHFLTKKYNEEFKKDVFGIHWNELKSNFVVGHTFATEKEFEFLNKEIHNHF